MSVIRRTSIPRKGNPQPTGLGFRREWDPRSPDALWRGEVKIDHRRSSIDADFQTQTFIGVLVLRMAGGENRFSVSRTVWLRIERLRLQLGSSLENESSPPFL